MARGPRPPAQLLTDSRVRCFRRCQQEHRYRYVLGVVPVESSYALRLGTLVHKGLEAWWLAEHDPYNAAEQAMRAAALDEMPWGERDAFMLVTAEAMLRGYTARWDSAEYETLGVEAEFRAPLVNPQTDAASRVWVRAGKIDVLAHHVLTGRTVIIEHKTSSDDISAGSNYWARLRLDSQVTAYFHGAAALGHHADAVIYDVLGKPKLRPLQANSRRQAAELPEDFGKRVMEAIAEDPDHYYARGEVVRLEEETARHDAELWTQALVMRDALRTGIAPKNPDACVRYGSTCPYFAACCGEESLDDDSRFYRLTWVHPELEENAQCPDPQPHPHPQRRRT